MFPMYQLLFNCSCIASFNPHTNLMRQILLLFPGQETGQGWLHGPANLCNFTGLQRDPALGSIPCCHCLENPNF